MKSKEFYCPTCGELLDNIDDTSWSEELSLSPNVKKRVLTVLGDCYSCDHYQVQIEIEYLEDK